MMPANVVESAQLAVIAPCNHDGLSAKGSCKKVSLVPHLVRGPHDLPRFRKHALLFEFVDARIEIPRRRNRARVIQRSIRIVEIKQVSYVSLHGMPLGPAYVRAHIQ